MTSVPAQLKIEVLATTDPEGTSEAARKLREELLELDTVTAVSQTRAMAAPAGAKGDPMTLGSLLVTLAGSGGILATVVGSIQSWLTRNERHSVTVEIGGDKLTISGASAEDQSRLVEAWITRHQA